MKAQNLEQVIQNFIPNRALAGSGLRFWYVEREKSPRGQMATELRVAKNHPIKLLLVGHRGGGKSTELNKLVEEIGETHVAIRIDIEEATGSKTPGYEELMFTILTRVTRASIDKSWVRRPVQDVLQETWQGMRDWWQRVVAGTQLITPGTEVSTYAQFDTMLGTIEVGAKQSSFTREELRQQLNRYMPDLLRYLNLVAAEVRRTVDPKQLLIIVENTDKIDQSAAVDIFVNHAATVTAPEAQMIYTLPIALRHSDHYNSITSRFTRSFFLHNWAPFQREGTDHGRNQDALRRIALRRMENTLIDDEALTEIVRKCGGVPNDLVILMRMAANYALSYGRTTIGLEEVAEAVKERRDHLSAPLSAADWANLKRINASHRLTNDPDLQRLFYNGSLIEYDNDVRWCDVHPILRGYLEYYTDE